MTAQTALPPRAESQPADPGGAPTRWWSRHRYGLIAYGVPVILTVLASTTWFSWHRFVAFLDVPIFLHDNMSGELTQLWNHQSTGAGSTGAPILELTEVLLDRGTALLGLPVPVGQWLLYAACYGLCAFGAAYLAAAWVRRPAAAAAAGLLATFNTYVLAWLPIELPALAIGLGGLWSGMFIRAARGRRIGAIGFALSTLPASFLALNPPWLLVTVLTAVVTVLGSVVVVGRPAARRLLRLLLRTAPLVVLVNLWWIVPLAIQLAAPAGSAFGAQTDIRDASSIQDRATVANVITLRAHWAWSVPGMLAYANRLSTGWRFELRWALPLLALAGAVLGVVVVGRRRRRAGWLLAGAGLVLIFLSTGVRSSRFGWVNLWLYDHVPGMWLIRDPAGKLGSPVVLVYAVLAALAIDRVADLAPRLAGMRWVRQVSWLRRMPWAERRAPRVLSAAPRIAVALLVLAALADTAPMLTGSAVPSKPHDGVPSSRVEVPAGWHQLADKVNARPGNGKVLVLPVNVYFYAFQTTWGYSGVDVVPTQLIKRPTLRLLPGGYYLDLPSVQATLVGAQNDLLTGNMAAWQARLRTLGVDTVVVRHDLQSAPLLAGTAISADPDALDTALHRAPGVQADGTFGVASLYQVPASAAMVDTAPRTATVTGPDQPTMIQAVAGLPDGYTALTDPAQPADAFHAVIADAGTVPFTLASAGRYHLNRGGTDGSYRVQAGGGHLTFTDADTVTVDGQPLPGRPSAELAVDAAAGGGAGVVALDVNGQLQVLPATGGTAVLGPQSTVTAYVAGSGNALSGPFQRAAECNGEPQGGLDTDPLHLSVRWGDQCSLAPLQVTAGGVYRVHFFSRNDGGARARACLWQDGPATCANLPAPGTGTGWTEYTAVTRLAPNVVGARLYLYAEASVGPGRPEFRDVTVTPLVPAGSATLTPAAAPATDVTLAKGRHTVTVDRAASDPGNELPEFAVCSLGAEPFPRYPTGNRMWVQPSGTIVLNAPTKTACTQSPTVPVTPGATYEFSADYRTDFGQTAKMCVRQDPSERCADLPALTRNSRWQTVRTLIHPEFGATGIRPEFSAGQSVLVPTRAAIRNVQVRRVSLLTVSALPADPPATSAPTVTSTGSGSTYRIAVHGASGPFTVVLHESYADGWALGGLPAGWTARHVSADGYANGWLVTGSGDAVLTARYGPQRWVDLAIILSLIALVLAIALVVGIRIVGVDRWRRMLARLRPTGTARLRPTGPRPAGSAR